MPGPLLLLLPVGKAALTIGGKMAMKAYFMAKMAGLKAFLTNTVGASAANTSVGLLAGACATIYVQKNILGNTDEAAINAAVAKGVSVDVAKGILRWIAVHV
jgi:hypothetical protein